ncbi:hypothetical protein C8Q76DRAFT_802262 [Earliella scabrosa]|nr:hypothetical protein C8Q76DRAFT_802262 [Earliella scabrosa]
MSPFTQPATTTPSRATYLLSVDIVRPATATTPAQLVLVDAPAAPVEVGMRVALEIHIAREPEVPNEEPSDNGSEDASSGQEGPRALDTGIRGYVAYVQCLWADAVEFIIRRDGHLGEFSYLVVPTNRHGFLRFNARLYQAWLNIEPFLVPFYAAKASLDHTGVVAGEELSSYIDSIASSTVAPGVVDMGGQRSVSGRGNWVDTSVYEEVVDVGEHLSSSSASDVSVPASGDPVYHLF